MPLYRPEPAQGEGRGQKRRRDDEFPQLSPKDAVVAAIIRVGDVSEVQWQLQAFKALGRSRKQ